MLEKESRMETNSFNFAPSLSDSTRYATRIPNNGVNSYKL